MGIHKGRNTYVRTYVACQQQQQQHDGHCGTSDCFFLRTYPSSMTNPTHRMLAWLRSRSARLGGCWRGSAARSSCRPILLATRSTCCATGWHGTSSPGGLSNNPGSVALGASGGGSPAHLRSQLLHAASKMATSSIPHLTHNTL